ncbi:MAG: response regulator, partial [Planctomycetes bacterium]|nr:response regulator [Planctomycetota bacterium]
EKFGYRADFAVNEPDALAALNRTPYKLGFKDCQMPGIDGYEGAREIRRIRSGASAPDNQVEMEIAP